MYIHTHIYIHRYSRGGQMTKDSNILFSSLSLSHIATYIQVFQGERQMTKDNNLLFFSLSRTHTHPHTKLHTYRFSRARGR